MVTDFLKAERLEIFKIRRQGFWFIWFILSAAFIAWTLNTGDISGKDSSRIVMETPEVYYFWLITAICELGSLFFPVMGSLLISRLADNEHKGENWRLLAVNCQNTGSLWDAKFILVYSLLEITLLAGFVIGVIFLNKQTGIPVPYNQIFQSFLAISGVNIINLTTSQILAFFYKNQMIVLIEGLLAGFFGLLSGLFPPIIVKFIPWFYYTLAFLCGSVNTGMTPDGLHTWLYYPVKPDNILILIVSGVFILINLYFRSRFIQKEQ